MAIDIRRVTRLAIGINTESGVERYEFDMRPWREEFPELNTFQINVTPPGGMPYKAETHMEGDYLVWPITDSDTALPGDDGMYEIEAFGPNGLHKLSPKKSLIVYERMTGDLGEAPSSIQTWVEEANAVLDDNRKAVNEAQQAAASANNAAEQANSAAEKIKTATNTSLGVVKGGPGILVKEDGSLFNANVHNLLDNSDFRNPVNQRGKTSYIGSYAIDRWRTWDSDAITIKGGYISVSGTIFQYIASIPSGEYTLAAKKTDGSLVVLNKSSDSYLFNGSLGFGYDGTTYVVALGHGDYVWAALYEGNYTAETLPPYVPKGYAEELTECQRYLVPIKNGRWHYFTSNNTTRYFIGNYVFPTTMRVTPTVVFENATVANIGAVGNAEVYSCDNTGIYQLSCITDAAPGASAWMSMVGYAIADL